MIDFEYMRKLWTEEALDILKYDVYYRDDDAEIAVSFVRRMKEWMFREGMSSLKADFMPFFKDGIIGFKVQFNADPKFGFEWCTDLGMLKRQRYVL